MRYCFNTTVILPSYRKLNRLCCQSLDRKVISTDVQRLRNPLVLICDLKTERNNLVKKGTFDYDYPCP